MKKLFYLFVFLFLGSFAFSSCSNDDDEVVTPAPTTGSIKAMVTPANSARNMRITQGSITREITPDAAGVFLASDLQAGSYSVSFTPATGFQAPNAQTASVTGGQITDLGTVTMTQGFPGNMLGTMSATVNGTPWISLIAGATVSGTDVTLTGSSVNMITASGEAIALTLQNVTGPGTYSAPNAMAIFTVISPMGGSNPPTWAGLNAVVNITKFDTSAKKLSGTFTFTAQAVPTTPATGTKTITNGVFTDVVFQ